MVIRLEAIIILLIILISTGAFMLKLKPKSLSINNISKDLEFKKTMFIEVDTEDKLDQMYAKHGIRYQETWTFDNLDYHSKDIKILKGLKGIYTEGILYLHGDVYMENTEGYRCNTQEAYYNQVMEKLYVIAPFVAKQGKNDFKGKELEYDVKNKEVFSKEVNAVFYTVKK